MPLRVVPSPTGVPSKRGPCLGSFSRADRGIGGVRPVAPPTWLVSNFLVKGAALFLQQGSSPQGQRSPQHPHKHAGDGFKLTLFPREFSSMRLSSPPTLVFSTGLLFKARALARDGVSREVPCSTLKGETVPDSLPATPKSPPTRRVPPRALAWEIPWTEEPGGPLSMGLHRVRHDCTLDTPMRRGVT